MAKKIIPRVRNAAQPGQLKKAARAAAKGTYVKILSAKTPFQLIMAADNHHYGFTTLTARRLGSSATSRDTARVSRSF